MRQNLTINYINFTTLNAPSPIKGRGSLPMSKTADIILCVVYSALLCGMGWLVVTVSKLEPQTSEVATLAPARPVKTVIYYPSIGDNVDKMPICGGGGDEDYKPRGPTMLAEAIAHRC
jgi:hypothetical protein